MKDIRITQIYNEIRKNKHFWRPLIFLLRYTRWASIFSKKLDYDDYRKWYSQALKDLENWEVNYNLLPEK